MDSHSVKRWVRVGAVALLLAASVASAATFNLYSPSNGIQKNTGGTYANTAATSTDIAALWSGSCSVSSFLRGDGACSSTLSGAAPTLTVHTTAGGGLDWFSVTSDGGVLLGAPTMGSMGPGSLNATALYINGEPVGISTGSVSSVGLAAPSVFSVSGSPVTSAGTLTLGFAGSQTANSVLATPDGMAGALSLRALVAGDLPLVPLSTGVTGVLPAGNGGTGVANSNTITLSGNVSTAGALTTAGAFTTSGANALTLTTTGATNVTLPTSGTLATTAQLPAGAALTKTDDTNVTLTLGGSPTTALVNAASITAGWTGNLSVARGGSGVGTLTGPIKGNGTSAFSAAASADIIGLWSGTCSSSTFLRGDGSCIAASATPAGSNTQVQFNNSGSFGASSGFTWSGSTLTATNVVGSASSNAGQFQVTSSPGRYYDSTGTAFLGFTSGNIGLYTGSSNRLGIDSTGKVAIAAPASGTSLAVTAVSGGTPITLTDGTVSAAFPLGASQAQFGTSSNHAISFYTNSNTRMTIAAAGNVTVAAPASGTTLSLATASGATQAVQITAPSAQAPTISFSQSGQTTAYLYQQASTNDLRLAVGGDRLILSSVGAQIPNGLGVGTASSGTTGEIRATNNITAYYSSDRRLKEHVVPIPDALAKVEAIRGVSFDWTQAYLDSHGGEDPYFNRRHDVGVIAQEVEKVLPEVVATRGDGTLAVKYDRMVPLLIEAIKDLKAQNDELYQRVKVLEAGARQ